MPSRATTQLTLCAAQSRLLNMMTLGHEGSARGLRVGGLGGALVLVGLGRRWVYGSGLTVIVVIAGTLGKGGRDA